MSGDRDGVDRRRVLQAIGVAGAFGLAGCSGGGGSDPTETGGDPTGTVTETRTQAATEGTPTATSEPGPNAGVSVDETAEGVEVTLNSLGSNADGVEVAGCAEGARIESVGGSTTVSGCEEGETVVVRALADNGDATTVTEYSVTGDAGCADVEPRVGVDVDRTADPTVATLTTLGDGTEAAELRGCDGERRLDGVGEAAELAGCGDGGTVEVWAVGCGDRTARVRTLTFDAETADVPPTLELTASVEARLDGGEVVATLTDLSDEAERAVLGRCADEVTLSEVGASTTLSGCSRGESVSVVAVAADGTEGPTREVTVEAPPEVPDDVTLAIRQDPSGLTLTAEGLGDSVTGVEVGGCVGSTIGEGESVTVTGCAGRSVPIAANHSGAGSVALGTYEFETTADGEMPAVELSFVRNGSRAAVLTTSSGERVKAVAVSGCGGDVDATGSIVKTESCPGGETVTISVRTA
jgi:hypothetical protein